LLELVEVPKIKQLSNVDEIKELLIRWTPKTNESISALVSSKVGCARRRQTNTSSDQLLCCSISHCHNASMPKVDPQNKPTITKLNSRSKLRDDGCHTLILPNNFVYSLYLIMIIITYF